MFRGGVASTSSGGRYSNGGRGLTADDLEVSEILLSLPRLIYSSVRWATKRKRSSIKSHPSPTRRPLLPAPSPATEVPKIKAKASSPTSPLAYPVDSDEKSINVTRKAPKRKRREELREEVGRLEQRRKIYTEEVEKVKAYYKQLLAENQALIAKKIEILGSVFNVKFPELESPEEISPKTGVVDHQSNNIHEEEPITGLGLSTTVVFPHPISQVGPMFPFAVGSQHPHYVGPIEIPDLNLSSAEPSQPSDHVMKVCCHCKVCCRWARYRRMLILKNKVQRISSSASVKPSSSLFL